MIIMNDELYHYGIIGMKWGVRRALHNHRYNYKNDNTRKSHIKNTKIATKELYRSGFKKVRMYRAAENNKGNEKKYNKYKESSNYLSKNIDEANKRLDAASLKLGSKIVNDYADQKIAALESWQQVRRAVAFGSIPYGSLFYYPYNAIKPTHEYARQARKNIKNYK